MGKIDNIDREIINLLIQDGRMSAADIARQLDNVSERVVRYRIERLISDGIVRVCAVPNLQTLGVEVIADVFIEAETGTISDVAEKLATYENVTHVTCSIGELDVTVQVAGRNNAEVYHFVTEVIGKLHGVRKTTTSIVPVTIKNIHDWRIPSYLIEDQG